MTVKRVFSTPAEVEVGVPATRDRAIDVIRIVSLVGVVVGHTIMATSAIRDDVFIWSNLLTASVVFQALTWVFQISRCSSSPASSPASTLGIPATAGATG